MKWFKNWFANKCREAWEEARNTPDEYPAIRGSKLATVSMSPESDWGDGLNIQVHAAKGGKIVTFRKYDRKSDRNNNSVYIIPDDHEFEKELGKLITLESMRM